MPGAQRVRAGGRPAGGRPAGGHQDQRSRVRRPRRLHRTDQHERDAYRRERARAQGQRRQPHAGHPGWHQHPSRRLPRRGHRRRGWVRVGIVRRGAGVHVRWHDAARQLQLDLARQHDLWSLPRRHGRLRHHDRSHQGLRQRVPGSRPALARQCVGHHGRPGGSPRQRPQRPRLRGHRHQQPRCALGRQQRHQHAAATAVGWHPMGARHRQRLVGGQDAALPRRRRPARLRGRHADRRRLGGRGLRVLRAQPQLPARPAASRCSATTSRGRPRP